MDKTPISCKTLGELYGLDGKRFQEQYVNHLSGYKSWQQVSHAEDWLLFTENMGEYLSIDETSLSHGELYTIVTNKAAKGRKEALVAMIKGTESERIIQVLHQIPEYARKKVKELTLDLAPTMEKIVRRTFPKAKLVADYASRIASMYNNWPAMPFRRLESNTDGRRWKKKTGKCRQLKNRKYHLLHKYLRMAIHLNSY